MGSPPLAIVGGGGGEDGLGDSKVKRAINVLVVFLFVAQRRCCRRKKEEGNFECAQSVPR